jgi:hypothetical protein
MAYIGKQPVVGNFVKLDAIVTSATATYNLLNGGVAYFPQTANNCIVSLNGVIQSPTSAYTISGSTIVFDSALTSADSIDFILVLGDVLSIGTPSDGTVTAAKLASGTVGLISWQSVQTTGFTASAGRGYPCNTTSSDFTVTLPASPSVGDTIILLDYAGTFDTNKITLGRNGNKIEGASSDKQLSTERKSVQLVYIDATQGWLVSSAANETATAIDPLSYSADFLVVAGGGSGGSTGGGEGTGGGGAGGYRNSYSTETSGGGGSSEASLSFVPGTVYTITVGAGGAAQSGTGNNGVASSISGTGITTITSVGGGTGAGGSSSGAGSGGSGGGGTSNNSGTGSNNKGTGTANQGFDGANGSGTGGGSGGGGSGAVGNASANTAGGIGGVGLASSITGSSVTRAGGGGGSGSSGGGSGGAGGTGGGGAGAGGGDTQPTATAGTTNTGSGGGGSRTTAGAGGSGVVILRIPTANYSSTTTGSPTVTTSGADTILVYNASGSITG